MADHRSRTPEGEVKSLAHQINVGIASSHTKINKLILDRMPRAVPPHTNNPSTYITGLLHIGAIYIAFESLWQETIGIRPDTASKPYTYPFSIHTNHYDEVPRITERTRHILETAYWPNMVRGERIKADIRAMTGWPDHIVDEQIRSVGTSGRTGKLTLHMRDSIVAKPHLLLAYAYSLYLALLSGGSYIRTELMYLKEDFWYATPTPVKPNMVECQPRPKDERFNRQSTTQSEPSSHGSASNDSKVSIPLEFLDFDPPLGDNARQQTKILKAEFKRRFAEAEQSLAEPERIDIIKESSAIFQNLEAVVGQLDKSCGTFQVKNYGQRTVHHAPVSSSGPASLSSRLRDSIAIAKGRLLRTTRRSSSGFGVDTSPVTMGDAGNYSTTSSSKISSASQGSVQSMNSQSELGRDAIIPADGFRTVRYGSDAPQPASQSGKGDEEKVRNPHGLDGAGFGRLSADLELCPMARASMMPVVAVQKNGPNYALYAIISNFVVLLGMAFVFAAYLYVRHGDARPALLGL